MGARVVVQDPAPLADSKERLTPLVTPRSLARLEGDASRGELILEQEQAVRDVRQLGTADAR